MKKAHFVSGIVLTVFITAHLFNHIWSLFGVAAHLEVMDLLRPYYRNAPVEAVLMLAIGFQLFSGIRLCMAYQHDGSFFGKLHLWSGLYMAFFLCIHVSAVWFGRLYLGLDTNFYFGAAGLNTFPFLLFFIPYYGLAIVSFFAHIGAIHDKKMQTKVFWLTPKSQAVCILVFGVFLAFLILYGLTNGFALIEIPEAYRVIVGG